MGLPRTPSARYGKWTAKYQPDVIASRFTAVQNVAFERAQDGMIPFADFDFTIAPILDKHGVAGPMRAAYRAFARKLLRHAYRQSGASIDKIALALKSYFVQAYGCDPSILDDLINAVLGYVPSY